MKKNKTFITCITFFQILSCISLFGIGFGSWTLSGENQNITYNIGSGTTDNGSTTLSNDYVDISVNKRIKKSELFKNTDTAGTDSNAVDKLRADFSFSNKNTNSDYNGELTDYFDIYDIDNPTSNDSPYLYDNASNNTIRLENHFLSDNKLSSFLYYQPTYDLIDTGATFDDAELKKSMDSIDYIISPVYEVQCPANTYLFTPSKNYTAQYQDITSTCFLKDGTTSFTSKYNYLRIYCSRTIDDASTYGHYRFHMFYYAKTGSSHVLRRIDSGVYNATDVTFTDGTYPRLKLSADNNTNTSKKTNFQLTFYIEKSSNTWGRSFTFAFNLGTNNTAGYDNRYEVIDQTRTASDFNNEECTKIVNELMNKNYSTLLSNSQYSSEYIDDSNAALSHDDQQYFKFYASRLNFSSGSNVYTRNYYVYVFYYIPNSNQMRVANIGNFFANNYSTSTDWPTIYIHRTTWSGSASSSALQVNKNSSSYIRVSLTRLKTDQTTYERIQGTYYFGSNNYNESINKDVIFTNEKKEQVVTYLKKAVADFKDSSTYTAEVLTDESNIVNRPSGNYFYFVSVRRKSISSSKYYFDKLYVVYYNKFYDNVSYTAFTTGYLSSESVGTTMSEWNTYTINNYHFSDSNISDLSTLNITKKGYNSKNTLVSSTGTITLGATSYKSDYTINNLDEINRTAYTIANRYSLQNNIDYDKDSNLYIYCDAKSTTDSKIVYKCYYKYYIDNSYSAKTINTAIGANLNSINNIFIGGYMNATNATDITPDKYSYLKHELYSLNEKNETKIAVYFRDKETNEIIKIYVSTGCGARTKGFLYRYTDVSKSEYFDLTYKIRLRAKNENVKNNITKILRCFNYRLDISMEKYDVYGNQK